MTVFDVFGNNNGAINNLIDFLKSQIGPLIGPLSIERFYRSARYYLMWQAPRRTISRGDFHTAATPDYITDYALTHTEFDPTYAVTSFADISVVTTVMDDFHHFLGEIDLSFTIEPNPFGNGTVTFPDLETNSTGFLSDLFHSFVAADYAYSCDDRNMSMKQGIFIVGGIAIVIFFVAKGLGDSVLPETITTMLVISGLILIIPILFFMIVYGTPLQNLFFLPVPVPPPCTFDDATDLIVCDVLPKCPAIVAGLVRGTYTESNCRTCPFEPEIINCKHDYDIRHGIDVILLFLEWLSPSFMGSLRGNSNGLLSASLGLTGVDLARYEGVDFSDKTTFDALLSCIGVMIIPTIPILALGLIVFEITASITIELVGVLSGNIGSALLAMYMLASHVSQLLTYNFIYVVTPGERNDFEYAVRNAYGSRAPKYIAIANKRTTIGSTMRYIYTDLGIDRLVSGNTLMGPFDNTNPRPSLTRQSGSRTRGSHSDDKGKRRKHKHRHRNKKKDV